MGLLLQGGGEDRGRRADRLAALFRAATGSEDLARDAALYRRLGAPARTRWFRAQRASRDAVRAAGAGDGARAAKLHGEALAIYRKVGDLRRAVESLAAIGDLAWMRGDSAEGLRADREALVASRVLGDRGRIARSLGSLAEGCVRTGDRSGALKFREEARRIFEEIGDAEGEGNQLAAMAEVARDGGDLEAAGRLGEDALGKLGAFPRSDAASRARAVLVPVHAALGDTARARELARVEEKRIEARRVEDPRSGSGVSAADLNVLGSIHLALGNAVAAARDFEAAEERALASGAREEIGKALEGRIAADALAGRADRALAAARRTHDRLDGNTGAPGLRDILAWTAGLEADLGRDAEALTHLQEAIAIDNRNGGAGNLAADQVLLGRLLSRSGKRDEARAAFGKAAELGSALARDDILWPAWQGLAGEHERAGAVDSALAMNGLAVEAYFRIRPHVLPGGVPDPFVPGHGGVESPIEARIRLLARGHERNPGGSFAEEAFVLAERAKARALLELLAAEPASPWSSVESPLREEQREIDRGLRALEHLIRGAPPASLDSILARRASLLARERDFFARARGAAPRVAALDEASDPGRTTLAALRRGLLRRSDALLLEYALGDSASWLWEVRSKTIRLHRLPPRREIRTRVRALRRALSDTSASSDAALLDAARALHRVLLGPVGRDALGADDVFIVPDDELHLLPFEALLADARRREKILAGLPYAFRKARVRYAPSARFFLASAAERERTRGARAEAEGRGKRVPPAVPVTVAGGDDAPSLGPSLAAFFGGAPSVLAETRAAPGLPGSANPDPSDPLLDRIHVEVEKEKRSPSESLRRAREHVRRRPESAHPAFWARWIVIGAQ
jgi:tetratricopeptide (TPR) repeat protein